MGKRAKEEEGEKEEVGLPYILIGKFPHLITSIDRLYKLVLEKKRVRISTAARIFKVKPEKIEEWGKILEEHDLLAMHYPVVGDAEIVTKELAERRKKRAGGRGGPRVKIYRKVRKKVILNNILIVIIGELIIYFAFVRPQFLMNLYFLYLEPAFGNMQLILYAIIGIICLIAGWISLKKIKGRKKLKMQKSFKKEKAKPPRPFRFLSIFSRPKRLEKKEVEVQKKQEKKKEKIERPKKPKKFAFKKGSLINYIIVVLIIILIVYLVLNYLPKG